MFACKAAPITASCFKSTRSQCTSTVASYFTNLGCTVGQVTCAGNPPPPGAAGNYQCSVESPTCTPLNAQGACPDGTTRVGALGMFACRPGG